MNIYRVSTEIFDYDQYDAVVLLAETPDEAKRVAYEHWLPGATRSNAHRLRAWKRRHPGREYEPEVMLVGVADSAFIPDEPGHLVLASYKAG